LEQLSAISLGSTAPCVSVVMPVFNEAKTVDRIVAAVLAQPCVAELVIVDDASSDDTWRILQAHASDAKIKLLRHFANRGRRAPLSDRCLARAASSSAAACQSLLAVAKPR